MDESEWQTRKKRIDTRLRSANPLWQIVPWQANLDLTSLDRHAVTEFPTSNGPADYALFVDGQLLGIIEAKKVSVNPQNVLEQAKRYAQGANAGPGNWNGLRVPFLYASNGEIIWHLDVRPEKPVSRAISHFHTAPALAARFAFNPKPAHDWLLDTPPDLITRLRDYQRRCIIATEQALISGRRELLLALATGTGKTFLTVAQIYRLLKSGLARRILFLVDRKALAAQAVREFNAFNTPHGNKFTQEYEVYSQRFQKDDFGDDDPFDPKVLPNEYLTAPKSTQTFVYVATIQRMARNLFGAQGCFVQSGGDTEAEAEADQLDIPIHAFDVIIADECHRGYTAQEMSVWRETINHFDAVKIGLTATPAAHTTALFGPPVFRYTVEQAILDGYLVDYEPVASGDPTNTSPLSVHLSLPGAVAITNTLTFKPDEETQILLRRVGSSFGTNSISIRIDSQSVTQLAQFFPPLLAVQLDHKTLATLEPRREPWWKSLLPLISTLVGAGIAFLASYWATTRSHTLQVTRQKQQDDEFVRKVLKSIEAELDALSDIFNQGIGGKLKAKTGRMFLVRLALSQDYFTVFGANAVHLGKIDPGTARAIITLYQTLKASIEGFRINNEYIQMYDAVLYQLNTSFPIRPDGVVRRAQEIEDLLNLQGDELVRLAQSVKAQYSAVKQTLGNPLPEPQPVSATVAPTTGSIAANATTPNTPP